MYAVVQLGSGQYLVEEGDEITVNRVKGEPGDAIDIENVLLVKSDNLVVGEDLKKAKVKAVIVEHMSGEKLVVFKYKRRKKYRRKKGHRQSLSRLRIKKIQAPQLKPSA